MDSGGAAEAAMALNEAFCQGLLFLLASMFAFDEVIKYTVEQKKGWNYKAWGPIPHDACAQLVREQGRY
jgi:hypothetical protein